METTAAGPIDDDYVVVLIFDGGLSRRIPPSLVKGFLPRVQSLPGFDNEAFIRAMSSVEDAKFLCWRRDPDAGLAHPQP